jgi:MerR family copper efflux transcriptional regulator
VKSLAKKHLVEIDTKMAELSDMRRTLSDLVEACAGDDRPDCPILKGLATVGSGR